MKKLLLETLKVTTVFACVLFMVACGGDECQTCTSDTLPSVEICDNTWESLATAAGLNADSLSFDEFVTYQEGLDFVCE